MRFFRITISNTQGGRVVGVAQQDTPFERADSGVTLEGEDCTIVDLGVAEEQAWTNAAGAPCSPSQHVLDRVRVGKPHELAVLHDVPCTMDGLRARLQTQGLAGVPVKVRAWLANVLNQERVDAMGLAAGLPISALKAAEALRNARDPLSGSRMPALERIAQQQADAAAAAAAAQNPAPPPPPAPDPPPLDVAAIFAEATARMIRNAKGTQ